jgi:ParB-like chromosome segregation protein Spo0J
MSAGSENIATKVLRLETQRENFRYLLASGELTEEQVAEILNLLVSVESELVHISDNAAES